MSTLSKPSEARHRVGAAEQSYVKWGSGPAVVIVHGVGGHKEDWIGVSEALGK